jgi:hypothetical protein
MSTLLDFIDPIDKPRARRRRLKIVCGSPRLHPIAVRFSSDRYIVGEVFTFAEWAKIPAHLRSATASFIAGVGYLDLMIYNRLPDQGTVDRFELESVLEQVAEAKAEFESYSE